MLIARTLHGPTRSDRSGQSTRTTGLRPQHAPILRATTAEPCYTCLAKSHHKPTPRPHYRAASQTSGEMWTGSRGTHLQRHSSISQQRPGPLGHRRNASSRAPRGERERENSRPRQAYGHSMAKPGPLSVWQPRHAHAQTTPLREPGAQACKTHHSRLLVRRHSDTR